MKANSTEKYRNLVTIHLVKITGELAHIREKVDANHVHLEKINGRLTTAEHSIIAIKTIGTTITMMIGVVLTWLGIQK
jgi:hypothetical protein